MRHPRTTPGFTFPAAASVLVGSRARTVMHSYPLVGAFATTRMTRMSSDPPQSQPSKWCRTSRSRAVSASSARYQIGVSLMRRSLGHQRFNSGRIRQVDGCFPTMLTSFAR